VIEEYPKYRTHTLGTRFNTALKATMPLWTHPLLPAVILMHDNLVHIRDFMRKKLKQESENLRGQLTGRRNAVNVQKQQQKQPLSNRFGGYETNEKKEDLENEEDVESDSESYIEAMSLDYESIVNLLGGKNEDKYARLKRVAFINSLNDLLTTAIGVRQAVDWHRRFADFLLRVWDDIENMKLESETEPKHRPRTTTLVSRQVKELIQNLAAMAAGFEAGVEGIISALEVQLNMVGVFGIILLLE
jgi:hypothetical protein